MESNPLVSIITVTYNSGLTLSDTIESVLGQDYKNIEYIIIDGNSKDSTLEIIKHYSNLFPITYQSECDDGLYDAMNKGIRMARGQIIGIINSDDFYINTNIISSVVDEFIRFPLDCVYGDVKFVKPENLNKTVRLYSSKNFKPYKFKYGFMPAHPTCFIKKDIFEKFGYYKMDYKIAADFELLLRFILMHNISTKYLPLYMIKMRTGGISTRSFKSRIILNSEIIKACKENNVRTNLIKVYSKYFIKIFEIIIPRFFNY